MANPVWSLTNTKIDNRGTKVNPALTTVTSTNPQGWETLKTYSNGTTLQYKIDPQGRVGYRDEVTGSQYANLQQYADNLAVANSTTFIQNEINDTKRDLIGVLTTRTQNTIPSQAAPGTPAPGQPPGQTPGSADAGPNQKPYEDIDPASLNELKNQLENFGDSNNKFGGISKFLKYPLNMNSGQDRIIIQQIEYVTSGITGNQTNISTIGGLLGNRESQFNEQAKMNILGSVTLPIPNDITETNQTAWGESSLSTIAAALMKDAAGAAQELANASPGELIKALKGLSGTGMSPEVRTRLTQYLTTNAAASLLKIGGINVDPEAYISRVTGTVINPNLELLFNGPKLRQFGFNFKMTPRSADEAKNIRSIIKFFKKGMAPRRSQKAAQSVFLGSPNVFQIKFKSGEINEIGSIGKIKTCALVSCTVNYTPDGFYAAYMDSNAGGSQPISVTMQLAFTEITPIYNDEYDAEGDGSENKIGPEGFDYKPESSSSNTDFNFTPEQLTAAGLPAFADFANRRGPLFSTNPNISTPQNPLTLPNPE